MANKGKGLPVTCNAGTDRSSGTVIVIINIVAKWWWLFKAMPRTLVPREDRGTHGTGDKVGSRCGWDGCRKYKFLFTLPRFEPRFLQHAGTRYTLDQIDNAEQYLTLESGSFLAQKFQLILSNHSTVWQCNDQARGWTAHLSTPGKGKVLFFSKKFPEGISPPSFLLNGYLCSFTE